MGKTSLELPLTGRVQTWGDPGAPTAAPQLGGGEKPSAAPESFPQGGQQGWDMVLGLTWGKAGAWPARPG